jgi:hypothetical protein
LSLSNFLLKNTRSIIRKESSVKKIKEALLVINDIYKNDEHLKSCSNSQILEGFVYYFLEKDGSFVQAFKKWVTYNHIYKIKKTELTQIEDINELVDVFDQIMASKSRTIFISMQFSDITKSNYNAIKDSIDDLNRELSIDLKLRQIRMDEF